MVLTVVSFLFYFLGTLLSYACAPKSVHVLHVYIKVINVIYIRLLVAAQVAVRS